MNKPHNNSFPAAIAILVSALLVGCGGGGGGGGGSPAMARTIPEPTNAPPVSNSPSLTLNWQAPSENVDGSPISGISGYRVYYGQSTGQYDSTEDVPGNVTSHTIELPVGQYFLVMTAIDIEGDESSYSNEVSLFSE